MIFNFINMFRNRTHRIRFSAGYDCAKKEHERCNIDTMDSFAWSKLMAYGQAYYDGYKQFISDKKVELLK